MSNDTKRICDKCDKFRCSADGMTESCGGRYEGSRVIPWMDSYYIEQRIDGEAKNCKGFKKLVTHF